jgi:hypothetical protein
LHQSRFVFASRHGEFDRTLGILQSLAQREPPSPADFSLSVHNALAGLLSIATRNPLGHCAIAAGPESFCYGLLEAATRLVEAPEEPIVLVFYDMPLPPPYAELLPAESEPTLALALSLTTAVGAGQRIALGIASAQQIDPTPTPAWSFLRFMLSGAAEGGCAGARLSWRWRHV